MKNYETISTLNQLLGVLCRSLPAYLSDARPWSRLGSWKVQTAIDRLVGDLRMYVRRVAGQIDALGGRPDSCVFPTEFTSKNDLAVEYLLGEIIDYLDCDAAAIERLTARLETDPPAHALAEEILGNVKGHLDVLKGLLADEE